MNADPYDRVNDPSVRLAVALVRENLGVAGEGELAQALPPEADSWQAATDRLRTAGLLGLPYGELVKRGLEGSVAPEVLERLRATAIGAATGDALRMRALDHVLGLLEPAGFEVFPIKGAAFSVLMPKHAQVRTAADLDLWVPGRAAEDANRLLQEHGYARLKGEGPEDSRRWHCHGLLSPEGGILVELHRRPWRCPREREAAPPSHARISHEQLTHRVAVPALEQLIVIQAAHAAVSEAAPGDLRTLWDVAALIRHGETDWDLVGELAARIGSLRGLKAVLSRVALLGLVAVPARLRMRPRDEEKLSVGGDDSLRPRTSLGRFRRRGAALDGRWNWLRTLLVALPPLTASGRGAWRKRAGAS